MSWAIPAIALAVCMGVVPTARSQQLEPRAYANSPTGMIFTLAGYGYSGGDVVLEASAPLEDGELTSNSLVLAFARSLRFWGDGGKTWKRWTYELVTGATFYTDNDEFLVTSTRAQDRYSPRKGTSFAVLVGARGPRSTAHTTPGAPRLWTERSTTTGNRIRDSV